MSLTPIAGAYREQVDGDDHHPAPRKPLRFGELHRGVDGITKKVLADTLRALTRDGMIDHAVHPDGHARYELTDLGRTLHEPLLALQEWAESHVEDVLGAQDRYDSAIDDQALTH